MRLARLIGPELETLLHENPAAVRELLDEIHPEDIADIVDELDNERAKELLIELPTEYAAQVFARIDDDRQTDLTEMMGLEPTARIATEMDGDDRADFFSELPPDMGVELLKELEKVDPEAAEEVEELTRWPESSAGGLMTTEYWSVGPDGTIGDALQEIRRYADESEVLDVIYVVDTKGRLGGLLTIRDVVVSDPAVKVVDVMRHNVITVPPELDQEEAARVIGKYDLSSLPVVDSTGAMLGLITPDDIIDVLQEEANEDAQKMGAVQPIEDEYLDASYQTFVRKRAPWLLVLFVGGFLTSSAMQAYDHVLRAVAQLSFYVPLLVSAGGNSGSQSSTLIIRALAVGDLQLRDWWRVLLKELAQGLTLGAMLALIGILRVTIAGADMKMIVVIGLAIVGIVVLGCLIGSMMPLLLYRLGVDPATSSTPFIATTVDVMGILIYLSLAQWIMADALAAAGGG
jgi:magnesium transporter